MALTRIFFDVTCTRVQPGAVGITRTVSRMAESLARLAPGRGIAFQPVTFHRHGFRACDMVSPQGLPTQSVGPILRAALGRAKPLIETLLGLPWPCVEPIWRHASSRAFERTALNLPEVRFRPGDALLLFDASWIYPVWTAAAKARQEGARVVPLVHDLMPIDAPEYSLRWKSHAYDDWLKALLATSDLVLCNSRATEAAVQAYAERTSCRLAPTRPLQLGNDLPRCDAERVRRPLRQFFEAGPTYACIGTLEPKKNYPALLDAFELLWREGATVRLAIGGRPTAECASVAARIGRMQAQGRPLLWLSDANDSEVAFMLGHARSLVMTTLFEGFGLPLVEARALGCPVIANDLPCLRELKDDGVELFEAGQPRLLADLIRRHESRALVLSREPKAGVTWDESARRCLKALEEPGCG